MITPNKRHVMFYEEHRDKAIALIEEQWADGWTLADICEYWRVLGYDIFFERSVIVPTLNRFMLGE